MSSFDEESLWRNNQEMVDLANRRRILLPSSPSQSFFRVYCILVVRNGENVIFVEGTNAEQGYIGGAICAERAALVSLRKYGNPVILKVVIVTDSVQPIAPGVLCREFLLSHADIDTEVVLGNCLGQKINVCKLGELYPSPYVYRYLKRDQVMEYAQEYASSSGSIGECSCNAEIHEVHRRALEVIRFDDATTLHPLQFAAGVLYENGDIEVSWMLKALEYGNTLDPVSQLVVGMERRRVDTVLKTTSDHENQSASPLGRERHFPKTILMTDQFGVCHAPFAMARSLLSEHNYGNAQVVVSHDFEKGYLTRLASDLAPPSPSGDLPLSRDDFAHICCA